MSEASLVKVAGKIPLHVMFASAENCRDTGYRSGESEIFLQESLQTQCFSSSQESEQAFNQVIKCSHFIPCKESPAVPKTFSPAVICRNLDRSLGFLIPLAASGQKLQVILLHQIYGLIQRSVHRYPARL